MPLIQIPTRLQLNPGRSERAAVIHIDLHFVPATEGVRQYYYGDIWTAVYRRLSKSISESDEYSWILESVSYQAFDPGQSYVITTVDGEWVILQKGDNLTTIRGDGTESNELDWPDTSEFQERLIKFLPNG